MPFPRAPRLLAITGGILWTLAVWIGVQAAPPRPSRAAVQPRVDYDGQVRTLFEQRCVECHSQIKRSGGLSLATLGDALDGGRSGPAIRPGRASDSLLLQRIVGDVAPRMPKDRAPLGPDDVAVIRAWIDEGARATPTSPPAPPPWEAPLALDRPVVPPAVWSGWTRPLDRLVAAHLTGRQTPEPARVDDRTFARRAYLDIWGLLPPPDDLTAFVADRSADKRERLVAVLLADDQKYAEHWISVWNDLLRNEDGVTYFSENAGRRSITDWLLSALGTNLPYDQFVAKLLNPRAPGDPEGFLIGVNWRGETSAAVTPWMQASQNTAQVFLGVNLKCNACHDSFISKWKLKDAYALAAYFSPEPKLQLFRCDVARDQYADPAFLYPSIGRAPPSSSIADRRATAAAIFTDPRNGRMPRTLVNRVWERLLGRGIVPNSDEMDGAPWSAAVLDWLASDFVEQRYDLKHLIATIVSSRAYQMPAVARASDARPRGAPFEGPEIRRMTAEQFADAIGSITGEWSVYQAPARGGAKRGPTESDPVTAGTYVREWRAASNNLTRALGRPIRDQVTSVRATQATTLQAVELVNGDLLTRWLLRGARRLLGELEPEPVSLFNAAVGGRTVTPRAFDVDVSNASRLWLVVTDTGSNAPERVEPVWARAELAGPNGAVPLSTLAPAGGAGLRSSASGALDVAVTNPSRLVYGLAGKGFTRFKGTADVENARSEIGSTLNPALRFFVFDAEPNMDRLIPPTAGSPLPPPPAATSVREVVDRVFWTALQRRPTVAERRDAEAAVADPQRRGRASAEGLADLLWVVLMKPEFQLIY